MGEDIDYMKEYCLNQLRIQPILKCTTMFTRSHAYAINPTLVKIQTQRFYFGPGFESYPKHKGCKFVSYSAFTTSPDVWFLADTFRGFQGIFVTTLDAVCFRGRIKACPQVIYQRTLEMVMGALHCTDLGLHW
jgi:hypothetical protein